MLRKKQDEDNRYFFIGSAYSNFDSWST